MHSNIQKKKKKTCFAYSVLDVLVKVSSNCSLAHL